MMNYDRSYPIQSNFDHHHHPSLSFGSTSYGNAKENKMYGGYNNQQYNQQYNQQQYGHYDNSNYDYGNVAYNTVNAIDEGEAGMAGVGARRMAERAAAQRQKAEEKRQRQMEEERMYYEQQKEEQRRYELRKRQEEEERRQREYEEEEQKRYQMEQQRREKYRYEEEKHRQDEKERQEQRSRAEERLNNLFSSSSKQKPGHSQQKSTEDSIWGSREIPAEEGTYHGKTLNTHKKDIRSRSSDQFWKAPQSRSNSNSKRQQTDSQSTAKQQDYRKATNHESQKMVSDGFGGLMLQVSEPKPSERISKMTDARQTVYDDDYEETEHLDTNDNDDGMWLKPASITKSPQKLNVPLSGDSKGVVVRQTVLEPLPKATCADCGDQLPFEELVGHECVRNACQSPLLTKGAGSISSRSNSPMPATSEKKGTFFDRYDRAQDENSNRAFLSPALTSYSPALSPRSLTSPLIGSDYNGSNLDEEEEKKKQERKRQIEAQRAAKKQALLLQTKPIINSNDRAISPNSATSLSPVDHHSNRKGSFERPKEDRSHRRGAESHSSSISTVSTKSSTSSFFMKPGSGTLTPSSSNELVCSTGSLMTKPFRKGTNGSSSKKMTTSPSKKTIDLEDIEGLMREIENSPIEDRKDRHQRKGNNGNANLNPKDAALRNQRPSESSSSIRHRNRSGTDASEVKTRNRSNTDASDRNQRPLMSRTRTQDQQKNTLCSVCLCAFKKNQPIVKRDGKLFCVDDYAELFLEKCRKCHEPVRTVGVRSRDGALTGLFHRECFSCLQCDASFDDGTFYIFENAAYCSHHYHVLNGTICQGCQTGIEGQCRQLTETGERFHQHCLTCQFDNGKEFCQELLQDYFFYGGKRFCEWHFEKVIQAVKKRENKNKNKNGQSNDDAIAAAEIRKARRTTYLRTVAAKKGRT